MHVILSYKCTFGLLYQRRKNVDGNMVANHDDNRKLHDDQKTQMLLVRLQNTTSNEVVFSTHLLFNDSQQKQMEDRLVLFAATLPQSELIGLSYLSANDLHKENERSFGNNKYTSSYQEQGECCEVCK